MQTGNKDFIYKNELHKVCFQQDMAYGKSKDLIIRTQSDKVLKDKAFKSASNPKYISYQRGLALMVYTFFVKIKQKEVLFLLRLQINLLMNQIINWQMNLIYQLLENFKKEKFIHHIEIIFRCWFS